MLAYLLGLFVNWRVLAAIGSAPCTMLIPGLLIIPESPRWLVGVGLLVLQQLTGMIGVFFYSSKIFQSAGISSSDVATIGSGAIQVVVSGITIWLVDKTGRRVLLVSSSIMTLSLLIISAVSYMEGFVSEDSDLPKILGVLSVGGLVAMGVGYALGMGPLPWLLMSEILPVNIKGLAGSLATFLNWFTAWLITMTTNLLLNWSSGGTFTIYAIFCIFIVAFVTLWVPETKERTLEEIQASFIR